MKVDLDQRKSLIGMHLAFHKPRKDWGKLTLTHAILDRGASDISKTLKRLGKVNLDPRNPR